MKQKIRINNVYIPLLTNENRYLILFGGAGSGKSVFAVQKLLLRLTTEKGHRILAIRKVATTLSQSVYKLIQEQIQAFGIANEFSINKTEKVFTHLPTGNEVICAGLDDPEKLKSITGITCAWVEEATELDQEDFDQLDLRIRGNTATYKQIILTFNPVDERHWLKLRFEDNRPENATVIRTTYEHNHFIDEEYKTVLEQKASVNPNYYRIYKLGEWGKLETQRPWAYNFDRSKHVSDKAIFNPKLPVYARFDFNIDPFVGHFGHMWTDKEGAHWHVFKSIVLNNGDVYKMCDVIKGSFDKITISSMYFTGDAMQRKREITQRNNIDAWRIMTQELGISQTRLQVPRSNPRVSENRHLVNAVLSLHPDYKIHPSCSLLINEYQYTESTEEGDIVKKNRNNEAERADAIDAERYALNAWLSDFIERNRR